MIKINKKFGGKIPRGVYAWGSCFTGLALNQRCIFFFAGVGCVKIFSRRLSSSHGTSRANTGARL